MKNKLIKVISAYRDDIKCAIIYGSYSNSLNKKVSATSDIDFLIVFKKFVNTTKINDEIIKKLNSINVPHDYCWYTEEKYTSIINDQIDYHLWYSVIFFGEVIFNDSSYVESLKSKILESMPIDDFSNAMIRRRNNIKKCLIYWARNLSILFFSNICKKYCNHKGITDWGSLPSPDEIIKQSRVLNLLNSEMETVYFSLRSITKLKINISTDDLKYCLLILAKYQESIEEYISYD